MSGYLQRLATSVVRGERRVQPLVGGLYTRQPEQTIEEVATTIVPRTTAVSRAAAPGTSHLPVATVRAASPRISSDEPSDEPRMEETVVRNTAIEPAAVPMSDEPHRRPLLAPVEPNSGFASKREGRTERAESPTHRMEGPAAPDLLVALRQFIEGPAVSQPSTPNTMQPLVGEISEPEAVEPPRATSLVRPAGTGPARTFARPPAAQPQTPSPMHAGGDDIQIHIGRIEVIAVPQQVAPRPVAAPARRGPTLEEYLQSRDRRSR